VYAYNQTGALVWTFNGTTKHGPNATLSDPLLLEHDSFLLVRSSFELLALKITSGKKVWNLTLEGRPRLEMKNCLTRNPVLNVIYFLVEKNSTSTLSAFNISNRVMLWQTPAFTQFKDQSLAVSVDGTMVYALNFVVSVNATNTTKAQYNQTLKAFSASTGKLLWTVSNSSLSGNAPDARPIVSPQGIVYIPTSNLEAYNKNGTKVWANYKGPYRACCGAFSGKSLYVPSYPNYIQTFNSASGAVQPPIPLNYTTRLVVAEAQQLFYVAANNTKGQPGHILYLMDSAHLILLWQRSFPTCKSLGYPLLGGSATNATVAYFYCADTDTLYQLK
jgi:outer membrane protein assembly factor BamB